MDISSDKKLYNSVVCSSPDSPLPPVTNTFPLFSTDAVCASYQIFCNGLGPSKIFVFSLIVMPRNEKIKRKLLMFILINVFETHHNKCLFYHPKCRFFVFLTSNS